jgi:hypothetical protein
MTALAWAGMIAEEVIRQGSHQWRSMAIRPMISPPHEFHHKSLCPNGRRND